MADHRDDDGGLEREGAVPQVPGHTVLRRLGSGGSGEVWLLEADDGGGRAALKLPLPGLPDHHGPGRALAAERWRVQGVKHAHLLPLRGVIAVERSSPGGFRERGTGLLMDFAPGGSVGSLVAARGTIGSGEVVTLVVPIAQALAHLHARGIVHGDVSPGNILFSADGRPLLADFGQAGLTGEGRERRATWQFADPQPDRASGGGGPAAAGRRGRGRNAAEPPGAAGDVYSLAAVAWWCLMGEPPGPAEDRPPLPLLRPEVPGDLALALEAALSELPEDRPSARDFARAVQQASPAAPVQIAAGAAREDYRELATALLPGRTGAEKRGRRSRLRLRAGFRRRSQRGRGSRKKTRTGSSRRLAAGLVVLLPLLFLLGAAVLSWRESSRNPVPSAPDTAAQRVPARTPEPAQTPGPARDPVTAARQLVVARGRALSERDTRLLDGVYRDGVAKSRDRELIERLRAEHRRYTGYRPVLRSVGVDTGATAERAVLSVTLATPSFLLSSEPGAAAPRTERRPARTESLRLTLIRADGLWLIDGVAPRG